MMERKIYSIILALLIFSPFAGAQDWELSPQEAAESNPTSYTLENVKQGKTIYVKNCKSCHGDPGKNNPLALVPSPVDIASEKMQLNSEGSLYHKITLGRGVMPPFEGTLSSEERWMLVHYIMNFNPSREQLLVDAPPVKAKLLASVDEEKRTVEIMAEYETQGGNYATLSNVPVKISSRKAFGSLPLGEVNTGDQGRAEFLIPEEVIGDEEGYISIVVSLGEDFNATAVILEEAIVGKTKEVPELIRKEVLWSTNENVSTWLLLSYLLATVGAWAVIFYVIFQVVKIRKYGKSSDE